MPARRLVLLLVLMVFVLGAVGAAQRDARRNDAATTTATSPRPATPATGVAASVTGTLPADEVVKARLGDRVDVSVRSETPDIAKVLDLGLQTSVGPSLPGDLRFTADRPGRFPVTLEVSGRRAGWIEIAEREGG